MSKLLVDPLKVSQLQRNKLKNRMCTAFFIHNTWKQYLDRYFLVVCSCQNAIDRIKSNGTMQKDDILYEVKWCMGTNMAALHTFAEDKQHAAVLSFRRSIFREQPPIVMIKVIRKQTDREDEELA